MVGRLIPLFSDWVNLSLDIRFRPETEIRGPPWLRRYTKTLHGATPPKNTVHKKHGHSGQAEHSTLLGKKKEAGEEQTTPLLCIGETEVSITRLDIPSSSLVLNLSWLSVIWVMHCDVVVRILCNFFSLAWNNGCVHACSRLRIGSFDDDDDNDLDMEIPRGNKMIF